MATKGLFTKRFIEQECVGEPGKKKFYRHGLYCLGLSVDRRSDGEPVKRFIFEASHHGRSLRIDIGKFPDWTVTRAEEQARSLRVMLDKGIDPRLDAKDKLLIQEERRNLDKAEKQRKTLTLLDAWNDYVDVAINRSERPLKPLTIRDYKKHLEKSFCKWQVLPLVSITEDAVVLMHKDLISKHGPAQANQAMRYLRAVLAWAMESKKYAHCLPNNPVNVLSKQKQWVTIKPDNRVLRREQLRVWFDAVAEVINPMNRAYLHLLLFTGCRPGEARVLKWSDVDFEWNTITFRDTKNYDDRTIPLPYFVAMHIRDLPKVNAFVFSSATSKAGHISDPTQILDAIVKKTGLDITLHGLRKSFATLSEWCDLPQGAVMQVMGHKPQGVHEKHYHHRPIDLLASVMNRYEQWILEQVGPPYQSQK